MFQGYETVRNLEKVGKLTAAGLTAQDPGFKKIWHEKAMKLAASNNLLHSFKKNLNERQKISP